jgi:hypothetical protein
VRVETIDRFLRFRQQANRDHCLNRSIEGVEIDLGVESSYYLPIHEGPNPLEAGRWRDPDRLGDGLVRQASIALQLFENSFVYGINIRWNT